MFYSVVLVLFVLYGALWFSLRDFSCSVSFIVLLLYLVGPIKYYDRLNGEGEPAVLLFVTL